MPQIAIDRIEAACRDALLRHGAAPGPAAAVARATAEAEGLKNPICGLTYLESYCGALTSGRVDGTAQPELHRVRPGLLLVDARQGFAQPAFDAGLEEFAQTVRDQGIAALGVARSHTCTSLGHFTARIARRGLVALGFTNAAPVVAPPGGAVPVLGTNPVAFSVPDGAGRLALHFDSATTTVALGTILKAKAAGTEIPSHWAVGPDGQPTSDPAAALQGGLTSLGGAKGFGFGLIAEIMASGMTGSVNSLDVKGLKLAEGPPHRLGQFYIALDPGAAPEFHDRVRRVAEAVTAQPGARMPGTRRVLPAEMELDAALWQRTLELAGW